MKHLIMVAMLVFCMVGARAAEYSDRQEALRTGIERSLVNQGFSVERQDDGLKFISDGDTYYIEIDRDENNPMYVRLCRYIKFGDKVKRNEALKNITELNSSYAVKAICKEKNLVLSAEMFVTSADQFNTVFNDLLNLMKSTYDKVENQ